MRLLHLSDVHVWRIPLLPWRYLGKRVVSTTELLTGRASRFRQDLLPDVVDYAGSLEWDHLVISGDLTTSSLRSEFEASLRVLEPLLNDPDRVTIVPGNHDRYTYVAARNRRFERWFGAYAPSPSYPWLRWLDLDTAILGLDPNRPYLNARGFLPDRQLDDARELVAQHRDSIRRLLVLCHYPVFAPEEHRNDLRSKRLLNTNVLVDWLRELGPHLYLCGHVHAAWAYRPDELPAQVGINPGATVFSTKRSPWGPGFAMIELDGSQLRVTRHSFNLQGTWSEETLWDWSNVFDTPKIATVP